MELVDQIRFETDVYLEMNGCKLRQGWQMNELTLYRRFERFGTQDRYSVEWWVPKLDWIQEIGIEWEKNEKGEKIVTGYDGCFEIPSEVIQLLEKNGFDCEELKY